VREKANFALRSLNQLLWPAVCINCGANICEGDENLCRDCWDELLACTSSNYCRRCGKEGGKYGVVGGACPDCQGKEMYFDEIARSGVYSKVLQEMILAFKLAGKTELDVVLGFLANSALEGCGFYGEIEYLVPVPMHWSRRLVRGYNQSYVLAKRLRRDAARINTDLVRIRRTQRQSMMASAASRAKNVAGAFAVRYGHSFKGRKVCLVDDIKTTGATLNECAKILKQAGASKVFALVLAVAGQGIK